MFIIPVEVDGSSNELPYYEGQDPKQVAVDFCNGVGAL